MPYIPYSLAIVAAAAFATVSAFAANPSAVAPPTRINAPASADAYKPVVVAVVPPPVAPIAPAAAASTPAEKPAQAPQAPLAAANSPELTLPPPPSALPLDLLKPGSASNPAACAPVAPPAKKQAPKAVPVEQALPKLKVESEKSKPEPDKSPFAGLSQTQVSDTQLNQFIFPEPVEGLYFPEGAPLPECPKNAQPQDPCKPIFLNGRKLLLLPLRVGAKGPIQMLAHMNSGRIISFNLAPAAGPGTLVRVDDSDYGASDARLARLRNAPETPADSGPSAADLALLGRFVQGDIVAGFEPIALAASTRLANFDLIPVATWSDGNKTKVHFLQVRPFADIPVSLNAAMFRGVGVRAVALAKDSATFQSPSMVYVLEEEAKQ